MPLATEALPAEPIVDAVRLSTPSDFQDASSTEADAPPQISEDEALAKVAEYQSSDAAAPSQVPPEDQLYCSECYLPLYSDPKPESLYIFLHAIRYTTSLGCFETEMPAWAAKGWTWDKNY